MIYVSLIGHTPDPERTIAAAARISTSAIGAPDLLHKLTSTDIDRLLARVIQSGHLSTLEWASFTSAIESISRVTSHRIASYTQQRQGYCDEAESCGIFPTAKELAGAKK